MSGQPVTTNPFMIMLINMTIVFGVLWILGLVMKVIYMIDPTKKKAEPAPAPVAAPAAVAAAPAAAPAQQDDQQLVAVIMAALSAHGCGSVEILSIRPIKSHAWTQVARIDGLRK